MVLYDGKKGLAPIIHNGSSLPPELMQSLEFLVAQCYARAGLTPLDTQGQQQTGTGNLFISNLPNLTLPSLNLIKTSG